MSGSGKNQVFRKKRVRQQVMPESIGLDFLPFIIILSGCRVSGLRPSHSANSRQMRLEDRYTDDQGIEETESGDDVSLLVPLCCVIFDLEPLFRDLIFLLVCLYCLYHLAILYLNQHAHTKHHLESLLTISLDNLCLDNLDIFKEDLEYKSLQKTLVTYALDLLYLLVLIIGTSQSRQHDKNESVSYYLTNWSVNIFLGPYRYPDIHKFVRIESRKSPSMVLFDVKTRRDLTSSLYY
ncbi:hypothetical protein Tco_1296426 [Tanacetum coccineum]